MIKYGVYFLGSEKKLETPCYDGRNIFLANSVEQAVEYKKELSENYCDGKYFKIFKLELMD